MNDTFEKNIEMLKKIISKLEDDNGNLDDSMIDFEEGMKLYNKCNKILKEAENKIEILNGKIEK
jgi:exodeoxyribonuclease VII small subunit